MKIELELLNDPISFKSQMLVVAEYIRKNTVKTEVMDFLGIPVSTKVVLKETMKNCGEKIEIEGSYRRYHVSCRRTKGGVYKFKVWNAV